MNLLVEALLDVKYIGARSVVIVKNILVIKGGVNYDDRSKLRLFQ